jgi:hypothetical protein
LIAVVESALRDVVVLVGVPLIHFSSEFGEEDHGSADDAGKGM